VTTPNGNAHFEKSPKLSNAMTYYRKGVHSSPELYRAISRRFQQEKCIVVLFLDPCIVPVGVFRITASESDRKLSSHLSRQVQARELPHIPQNLGMSACP
jgi:hypothetical protein